MKNKSLKIIFTLLVLSLLITNAASATAISNALSNVTKDKAKEITEDAANKTIEYAKDKIDEALENNDVQDEINKIREDYEAFKNKNWFMRMIDNIVNFFKNLFNPSNNKKEILDTVNKLVKETKTDELIEEKTNDTKKYIEDFVNKELETLNDLDDDDEDEENKKGINININFGNINIEDQSKNIEEASKLINNLLNKNNDSKSEN